MARRSNSASAGCVLVLVLVACCFWVYDWFKHNPIAIAIGGGVFLLFLLGLALERHNFRRSAAALVAGHRNALLTRRRQLSVTTHYGTTDVSRWAQEIEIFLRTIIEPAAAGTLKSPARARYVRALVDLATADYANSRTSFSMHMDPRAYEAMVADALQDIGWTTRLTKGSGDQGVDVIAEMREKRVVIQCKRYQSPIGNGAVQEAYAGRSFEDADFAAVVSNAGFTVGARQIAEATRVVLLHHDELHCLEEYIFGTTEWKRFREPPAGLATESAVRAKPAKGVAWEAAVIIGGTILCVAVVVGVQQHSWSVARASPASTLPVLPADSSNAVEVTSRKEAKVELAFPEVADSDAVTRIEAYCRQDDKKGESACKRNESRAWYRIAVKHEFHNGVSTKCDLPPYPDSYTVKETCMQYEGKQ
jgi:restriction system protein